jgi:hypothetical protein
MRWIHVAQRSGAQVGESSMTRSCRLLGGYSGMHLALPLARHDKTTRGRVVREASEWVQPNWGINRPPGNSVRTGFRPGDCQVGPKQGGYGGVCSVSSLLSRGCGPLDLRACS